MKWVCPRCGAEYPEYWIGHECVCGFDFTEDPEEDEEG